MVMASATIGSGDKKAASYLQKVMDNRKEYARYHGYKFVAKTLRPGSSSKTTKGEVDGWSRLFALREALEEYPDSEWFWYLDQDAIIMAPQISLTETILGKLGSLALRDVPIVPPDSVIRTLKSSAVENTQFILSQDHSGLNTKSFLLRNSEFSRYLLESWTEPVSHHVTSWKSSHALTHDDRCIVPMALTGKKSPPSSI